MNFEVKRSTLQCLVKIILPHPQRGKKLGRSRSNTVDQTGIEELFVPLLTSERVDFQSEKEL